MHWDRLVRVAAPAVAPIDYDTAKAHLRLYDDEDRDDVEDAVAAAVAAVDGPRGIGIAMVEQTWKLSLDAFCWPIRIPLGPVISVDSVKYLDEAGVEQTLASDKWTLSKDQDPAILAPAYGLTWPTTRCEFGAVRITFTAGYGPAGLDVPSDLRSAVKLIVASLYDGDGSIPVAACRILDRYAVKAPG